MDSSPSLLWRLVIQICASLNQCRKKAKPSRLTPSKLAANQSF